MGRKGTYLERRSRMVRMLRPDWSVSLSEGEAKSGRAERKRRPVLRRLLERSGSFISSYMVL